NDPPGRNPAIRRSASNDVAHRPRAEPRFAGREMRSDGQGVVRERVMSLASYLAAPPRGRVMSGVYPSVPPSPCQGEAAAQNRSRERTHGDEYAGEVPTNQPTGGTMCPR